MLPEPHKKQASEKVRDYLNSIALTAGNSPTRLPSVRRLAKHLGVSASTVATVYRQIRDEGHLHATIGSGSFLTPLIRPQFQNRLRLTINLPSAEPESIGPWYSQILGELTLSAMSAGIQLTIQNFDTPQSLPSPVITHDAALIVPSKVNRDQLIHWADTHQVPTVYLNPQRDNSTENFVSPDYFGSSELLGKAFFANGRRRILFINNLPYNHGASNRLRISGLLSGVEYGSPDSVKADILFTNYSISIEAGREAISRYIDKHGTPPDAVYTPGDLLAIGSYLELTERGLRCPEDVSIAGGTGLSLDHTACPQLTRAVHPYNELGRELIRLFKTLLTSTQRPLPGSIIPMRWLGGATTTAEENRFLFI